MDRKEIAVIERPDNVSWEDISRTLRRAHEDNVKKGIVLPYPHLPPEEIEAKTEGRGGKMFVALDEGKVVATGAVAIIEKDLWCGNGKYAYCFLASVLPEYAGQGLYRKIVAAQEDYAKANGVFRMMFDTDERNTRMLEISIKNGYRRVTYRVKEGRNSVLLVKWLNGCPYSKLQCYWKFIRIRRNRRKQNKTK